MTTADTCRLKSEYDTGVNTEIDLNDGLVNYQSRQAALDQGLVKVDGNEVYIGVDHTSILKGANTNGRPSVRLESKAEYNHGLFIARFSHLPESKCGTRPAL